MGFDFINKTKGTARKSFSAGFQKYSNPTLLQKKIKGKRIIKVVPINGAKIPAGELLEVSVDGSRIVVCAQTVPIGINDNPPPSVVQKLLDESGMTIGMVDEVSPDGSFVNISMFEDDDEE